MALHRLAAYFAFHGGDIALTRQRAWRVLLARCSTRIRRRQCRSDGQDLGFERGPSRERPQYLRRRIERPPRRRASRLFYQAARFARSHVRRNARNGSVASARDFSVAPKISVGCSQRKGLSQRGETVFGGRVE